jgi:hypothetical protein
MIGQWRVTDHVSKFILKCTYLHDLSMAGNGVRTGDLRTRGTLYIDGMYGKISEKMKMGRNVHNCVVNAVV